MNEFEKIIDVYINKFSYKSIDNDKIFQLENYCESKGNIVKSKELYDQIIKKLILKLELELEIKNINLNFEALLSLYKEKETKIYSLHEIFSDSKITVLAMLIKQRNLNDIKLYDIKKT